jgi:hypothetical protein
MVLLWGSFESKQSLVQRMVEALSCMNKTLHVTKGGNV